MQRDAHGAAVNRMHREAEVSMAKGKAKAEGETVEQRQARYVYQLCQATMETDKGLRRLCDTFRKDDPDFPAARTVREWFAANEELNGQYARAKAHQLEHLAEQIIEISDDDSLDMGFTEEGKPFVNTEHIQRSKLRVDSRKWILSKLNPKKYGDKLELAGDPESPIMLVTKVELVALDNGTD